MTTSKKETTTKSEKAEKSVDIATDDQKEAQDVAKKLVENRHDAQTTVGASDAEGDMEEIQSVAEEIVNRQHDNQTTVGPSGDD